MEIVSPEEEYQKLKERLILTFDEEDRLKKIAIRNYKRTHNITRRINLCDIERMMGIDF